MTPPAIGAPPSTRSFIVSAGHASRLRRARRRTSPWRPHRRGGKATDRRSRKALIWSASIAWVRAGESAVRRADRRGKAGRVPRGQSNLPRPHWAEPAGPVCARKAIPVIGPLQIAVAGGDDSGPPGGRGAAGVEWVQSSGELQQPFPGGHHEPRRSCRCDNGPRPIMDAPSRWPPAISGADRAFSIACDAICSHRDSQARPLPSPAPHARAASEPRA